MLSQEAIRMKNIARFPFRNGTVYLNKHGQVSLVCKDGTYLRSSEHGKGIVLHAIHTKLALWEARRVMNEMQYRGLL